MKPIATSAIAIIVIIAAIICGAVNLKSETKTEPDSRDYQDSYLRPMHTESNHAGEHKSTKPRVRVSDPEADFLSYLCKIEPITDFEEPADGYFEGYLLARGAGKLFKEDETADSQKEIFDSFEKSYAYFLGVQQTAPEWKKEMVLNRLDITKRSLRDAYFANKKGR
jgi:hypothetical protein